MVGIHPFNSTRWPKDLRIFSTLNWTMSANFQKKKFKKKNYVCHLVSASSDWESIDHGGKGSNVLLGIASSCLWKSDVPCLSRVFLSHLWVPPVLMALFVFLTFLLHLLWSTTFFLFVNLQLTIPVPLSLTLLVLLWKIWLPSVLCSDVTAQSPFTLFGFWRLLPLHRRLFCLLSLLRCLPPLLGTVVSAILDMMRWCTLVVALTFVVLELTMSICVMRAN